MNTSRLCQSTTYPGRGQAGECVWKTLHLELEMPEVVVYDWDKDNDPDLIAGMEDGRVVFIENNGVLKALIYTMWISLWSGIKR